MKSTIKIFFLLTTLLFAQSTEAHQPDLSSTMLVEQDDNNWILQIRAALTAFEYETEQRYGKDAFATPEEFRNLVLEYVQANIKVLFNETNLVVLKNGKVKLGHETSITFEITNVPADIQYLTMENSTFNHISRNQSALIILKKGFAKDQFVLNNKNEHKVELQVKNAKFELVTPLAESKTSGLSRMIVGLVVSMLLLLFFMFKKSMISKPELRLQTSS